jgi:hypothetical protein
MSQRPFTSPMLTSAVAYGLSEVTFFFRFIDVNADAKAAQPGRRALWKAAIATSWLAGKHAQQDTGLETHKNVRHAVVCRRRHRRGRARRGQISGHPFASSCQRRALRLAATC